MSIGKQLVEQLRRLALAEAPHTGAGALLASAADGSASASAALAECDRFSAALHTLEVRVAMDAPEDAHAFLSERAARLCQRLSYLEEPLGVWELDGREGLAQLRSTPPQREGDEVQYWEVTLAAGQDSSARISRYRWAPGMPEREPLPYPATFGLLGRLADSIAGALEA